MKKHFDARHLRSNGQCQSTSHAARQRSSVKTHKSQREDQIWPHKFWTLKSSSWFFYMHDCIMHILTCQTWFWYL